MRPFLLLWCVFELLPELFEYGAKLEWFNLELNETFDRNGLIVMGYRNVRRAVLLIQSTPKVKTTKQLSVTSRF